MIYFDNNSTTRPFPEVVSVVAQTMTRHFANPFTQYQLGKNANRQMENSRSHIKKLLGIRRKEFLLFTSSATESNNMVVRGRLLSCSTPHIIITSIEHSSIFQTCRDLQQQGKCSLSIIQTDCQGRILLSQLKNEIKKHAKQLALICIILANNEIGVIQDLPSITKVCRGHFLHIDATQYIGKYPIHISSLGIQSLTFGSHKFHGPRMGGLYIRDVDQVKNCCCTGGRSEYGLRSGTPNLAYILGMEKALAMSTQNMKKHQKHIKNLCDYLQKQLLQIEGVRINSLEADRLYNTISVVLPVCGRSKQLVKFLDQHGICVNVGSACNKSARSRVLDAIGLSLPEQKSTLRLSLCHANTRKECIRFMLALKQFLENI